MRPIGTLILIGLLVMVSTVRATDEPERSPPHDDRRSGKQPVMPIHIASQGAASSPQGMRTSQDVAEPDRAIESGIGCNWNGWQYTRSPKRCWRCQAHTDTLRTLCTEGWVQRIEKVRVCAQCWEGK